MVIKPADKGGKIFLWPRKSYIEEANKQLGDTSCYEEQTDDKTGVYKTWPTPFGLPFGLPLAHCWLTLGLLLAYFWITAGLLVAHCWPT